VGFSGKVEKGVIPKGASSLFIIGREEESSIERVKKKKT